jgi:hypothetical protein
MTGHRIPSVTTTRVLIVGLALLAAGLAMWRVRSMAPAPDTPYFPPGHIQIASPTREGELGAAGSESSAKAPENQQDRAAAQQDQAPASPASVAADKTSQEPQKPPQGPTASEVRAALTAWRLAWESRDVANYMRFYHPNFSGRENFERQKNTVMTRAKSIEVGTDDIQITEEAGRVRAVFLQTYRSDTYQSRDVKTQIWVGGNDGPQILSESIQSRRDPTNE